MYHYRIVKDTWNGFEAQCWVWWFPFWRMCFGCNTSDSMERAEQIAMFHKTGLSRWGYSRAELKEQMKVGTVLKHLGTME